MQLGNIMTYYIVYVFPMAGLKCNMDLISSGGQFALFVVFTTATFFFVDNVGRRPLLMFGTICMGIWWLEIVRGDGPGKGSEHERFEY